MSTRLSDIRHFAFIPLQSKIGNRNSATPTLVASTRKRSVFLRGHSSVGRAPALQAGSQGFESPCLQSLKGVEAKSAIRAQFRMHERERNPLASSPESFRGCPRRSLGEGGLLFTLRHRASYDSASHFIFDLRFAIVDLSKCARNAPVVPNRKSAIEIRKFRGAAAIPGL